MNIIVEGKLMDVIETDYEIEGKKGKSYKLAIYRDGKIENVKVKKDKSEIFSNMVGEDIKVEAKLFITGKYSLNYIEE